MRRCQLSRKRLVLYVEVLEARVVPTVTVALTSANQFGPQIQTVQGYNGAPRVVQGILDTGASTITFSAANQAQFTSLGYPIPILAGAAASASGIGGSVQGNVSLPGAIYVDGMHVVTTGVSLSSLNLATRTPGIQAFVGTATGSASLPTLTGTAIFEPSAVNPQGLAALVALQATTLTSGGPDVRFVSPATSLSAPAGTTLVRIPLTLFGPDNYSDPGNQITVAPIPVYPSISLNDNNVTVSNKEFLFDTGSQVTIISSAMAGSLGLNLAQPTSSITIQGVGGPVTASGFTVPSLSVGNLVTFTNVPIYVLNVGSGFDGVLGMNLFGQATSMLYNPYAQGGASLSVAFLPSATGNQTPGTGTTSPGTPPVSQTPTSTAQPGTSMAGQPSTATSSAPQMHTFTITVSLSAAVAAKEASAPGLAASSNLFITLQAQPLLAAQPFSTGSPLVLGIGVSVGISLHPGYGVIFTPEALSEAGPSGPSTPVPSESNAPRLPLAPEEAMPPAPSAPEAPAEAVTAFFASLPQATLRDEASDLGCDGAVAADSLAKLAIVVAGLSASLYKNEPARERRPVVRTV